MKGTVTPARLRALEQLVRHGRARVGAGMWNDDRAAVSAAGASWLLDEGLAVVVEEVRSERVLEVTELGRRAWAELEGER